MWGRAQPNPHVLLGFLQTSPTGTANENRSKYGKIPGNPAQSPGESPGRCSRVPVAFAALKTDISVDCAAPRPVQ